MCRRSVLIVGLLLWGSAADAQPRAITRGQLDPKLREQLDRGKLVRISAGTTDTIARASSAVTIRPGEVIAAKTGEAAVVRRTVPAVRDTGASRGPASERVDTVFAVPFTYLGFDRSGGTPTYEPVFIRQGRLRYSKPREDFEGSFLIGLELAEAPGEERDLARGIGMTFGGDADSIAPPMLEFKRAGGPQERVLVVARAPRDSLAVEIVPRFLTRGVLVWLPVEPTLAFETPPTRIQGYGVESRPLKIVRRGTSSRDTIAVAVSSDRGSLSASEVLVGPAGGEVTLRSGGGLGRATVHAVAQGYETGEAIIQFGFPSLFLGAAVLGGTTGAVFAELRRRRRRGASSPVVRRMVGAILGAVVATAVYVGLGINLLALAVNVPLANEIAVFAFAALGAILGRRLLSGEDGRKRNGT